MGLNQTFDKSAIIFVVIGMIFGWPYALLHFSALQWINTSFWKRLVRTILGVSITVGNQVFFTWVTRETNDIATKFFFGEAVPFFLNSYFIFGLFPILCKHMRLVQQEDTFVNMYPELASRSQLQTSFTAGLKQSPTSLRRQQNEKSNLEMHLTGLDTKSDDNDNEQDPFNLHKTSAFGLTDQSYRSIMSSRRDKASPSNSYSIPKLSSRSKGRTRSDSDGLAG